jgi:hypothetical protein
MASTKSGTVSISDLKSNLLRPALTSHYICTFTSPPTGFVSSRLKDTGSIKLYDRLSLACSEASLPGSSLATIDVNNDYHGVSEKHAYRRLYDDRADFTFYVDSEEYYVIRFFETWIGYVVNEQYGNRGEDIKKSNYNYRVNYPEMYRTDGLFIKKFERSIKGASIEYQFINAFPIGINSIPVSYDSSQLLKCTVSFTYSRYILSNLITDDPNTRNNENAPAIPELKYQSLNPDINTIAYRNKSNLFSNPSGASASGFSLPADYFSRQTSSNFRSLGTLQ